MKITFFSVKIAFFFCENCIFICGNSIFFCGKWVSVHLFCKVAFFSVKTAFFSMGIAFYSETPLFLFIPIYSYTYFRGFLVSGAMYTSCTLGALVWHEHVAECWIKSMFGEGGIILGEAGPRLSPWRIPAWAERRPSRNEFPTPAWGRRGLRRIALRRAPPEHASRTAEARLVTLF